MCHTKHRAFAPPWGASCGAAQHVLSSHPALAARGAAQRLKAWAPRSGRAQGPHAGWRQGQGPEAPTPPEAAINAPTKCVQHLTLIWACHHLCFHSSTSIWHCLSAEQRARLPSGRWAGCAASQARKPPVAHSMGHLLLFSFPMLLGQVSQGGLTPLTANPSGLLAPRSQCGHCHAPVILAV